VKVRLERPTLETIDGTHSDSMCVFVFEDMRPLKGLAGLVDWRVGGALSSLVQSGWFTGAAGERLLMPVKHKLPVNRLFCFGVGPARELTRGSQPEILAEAFEVLRLAGVHGTVLTAPGRAEGLAEDIPSLELVCSTLDPTWDFDEVVIVDEFRRMQDAHRKLDLYLKPLMSP
jgi:hypothetical protein